MDRQELISVIIPVYNVESYLARCLDSVLDNTYRNLEVICINDGSTDSCLKILQEYARKDERVLVIDQNNLGISAARNAGMDVAKGEWLAFIDSDDWVHPQYFEILLHVAKKTGADVTICDTAIAYDDKQTDKLYDISEVRYKILAKEQLQKHHLMKSRVWGKLYLKSTVGDSRFFSGVEPVEDKCFNALINSSNLSHVSTECRLYHYFMRNNSAVHTSNGRAYLKYARYISPLIETEKDKEKQRDLLKSCYKSIFSARYLEMYSKDYQAVKQEIDEALEKLKPYQSLLSLKDRISYGLLCDFPAVYRALRIINDPSLLKYEKGQKAINKN